MTAAATFALCIFLGMLLAGGRKKRASPTYKETSQAERIERAFGRSLTR
jgi:hypothetical protein